MEHKKKLTLDDIFNEVDELGLLELKEPKVTIKTEEDRLIDSFEEINTFYQDNDREPGRNSMAEYSLASRLSNFKKDEEQKKMLKPFDRYNLLGEVEMELASMDDILAELDDMLEIDDDLSIFEYKHIPKEEERAETDFVAQRKPMSEREFRPYEKMFLKVHEEIKEGKRKLISFSHAETNLIPGNFYVMDGLLLYFESADLKREKWEQKSGNRIRLEGRTRTIFENGTWSNMYFRSLGKQIGKMVTNSDESVEHELFVNANLINEEDVKTGWIYVLKSKSTHPDIASVKNLYKIGATAVSVDERISNAANEATYLYADVHKVADYALYNRDVDKLEELIHRFFAEVCLDIDVEVVKGKRVSPREWFVAPFEEIDKAIKLIITEKITNYKYDSNQQRIMLKPKKVMKPTKENTLYLTIKQVYFDAIMDGSKKNEYREVKDTTISRYLEMWKEGKERGLYYKEAFIDSDLPIDINIYNNGEFPFVPREYKYLRLAVGYGKERDEAIVEVTDITFEPMVDKAGKEIRFDDIDGEIVPNKDGELTFWIINYHLGEVVEKKLKKTS